LNSELAPLARRDSRRAAAWGTNRQRLAEELGPLAVPSRGFADDEAAAGQAPGYDPIRARQFLEAAKYYTGIRIAVTVPRGSALAAGLEALTPSLARASIQVDAVPVSTADWARAAIERRGSSAVLVPWQAPADDELEGLASMLLNRGLGSGWAGNLGWYRLDGLDSLLIHGLKESDPVARQAARDQVGTLLESDLPLLPIARMEESAVLREGWGGARFQLRNGLDLRRIHRRREAPSS
jgi:ABC-type transport system substrate-binding protein